MEYQQNAVVATYSSTVESLEYALVSEFSSTTVLSALLTASLLITACKV
ncbi:MAG: hypothetical protein QXG58_04540 [Candidatus Bathyarchaeia archaeon]